ncbi:unnamed protein product [Notodromas monacha]|uniref:UBC core domain-containing protein n=1 Tax=Notodromas monacha TaxID=399045 RepID=A0A7R9GCR4_9CRUS|nr:unnamed protein product [Notodromas monacha]CAG0917931.1 unnamed protein product [Notodromas monacha]
MNSRVGHVVETSFTRKLLPAIPNEVDRAKRQAQNSARVYGRYLKEFLLSSEYKKIKDDPPPGIYVIPYGNSPLIWHGVLFVRHGYFQGGVFRFRVEIPEAFPETDECPKVIFVPPLYHPLVDPETGEFDLSNVFPKWCCSSNSLQQVLRHVRNSFYSVAESSLDENAALIPEPVQWRTVDVSGS